MAADPFSWVQSAAVVAGLSALSWAVVISLIVALRAIV